MFDYRLAQHVMQCFLLFWSRDRHTFSDQMYLKHVDHFRISTGLNFINTKLNTLLSLIMKRMLCTIKSIFLSDFHVVYKEHHPRCLTSDNLLKKIIDTYRISIVPYYDSKDSIAFNKIL